MKCTCLTICALVAVSQPSFGNPVSGLTEELVFTTEGIDAQSSDFMGPTASGGPIHLQDFHVRGNLWTTASLDFARGRVDGSIQSSASRLQYVSYDRDARVDDTTGRASFLSEQMKSLALHLAALQSNAHGADMTLAINGQPMPGLSFTANKPLTVIDVDESVIPRNIFLSADHGAKLLIRVHGTNVDWSHKGVFTIGDISPDQISFFFPEATAIDLSFSGGSRSPSGERLGVPGSILAPAATFKLESVLVTGQVFVRFLQGAEARSGQVNFSQSELFEDLLQQASDADGPSSGAAPPLRVLY